MNITEEGEQMKSHTQYYKFVEKVEMMERPKHLSYNLHMKLGYPTLYHVFKAGKADDFIDELREALRPLKTDINIYKNAMPVVLNDDIVFDSISEASRMTGVSPSSIHNNIKGISKRTLVGTWTYANRKKEEA